MSERDDAQAAQDAHLQANLAAKALVEAISGVGEKGRILTELGPATVSDVRAHGPLVILDGIAESGEAYRIARHWSAVNFTVVLTDRTLESTFDES